MQTRYRGNVPEVNSKERSSTAWLWVVLAAAGGVALALVLLPVMVPALAGSVSGASPHVYWYISRASAFVAYILLWISMLAGLGITSRLSRAWPGMPASIELHRYTSVLGLGFALFHALILVGDQYINYSLGQVLVPFMAANYRPEWVGFGQLALYLLAVVALSFYVRDRIGVRTWRVIHVLSFALFLTAMIHGLQSGTDSSDWWALTLYWLSMASVLFGSIYRVLVARLGRRREELAASGLLAVGGKEQPRLNPQAQYARVAAYRGARYSNRANKP